MKRYLLKKGDKSSNGGVVIEGVENCTHHGTALTYVGAQVYCHGCKSVGHIAPKGPRWPDLMHGKQQALDGDICVCKCQPSPVMIAAYSGERDHAFRRIVIMDSE
ncbi:MULTISPECIES: PAAR domain-containing protein [Burkholderia cepacia complex]|uniref:PAAR domain-containing protein n=1 Tax=Burkholderia cepacia complex TaxID=87882 RepID=UPI001C932F82|nr:MULTISPECIES: PAAR domain-containing protein [Burkholderia cepacia complex]MBY4712645.1 PAAR domain-containing protein [Burkholderia cepacia]MBY4738829.1 PAAR domain-containing protein [Burkholderia cepacia]MBY4743515.1 PAAR domain-containing protein [Burkholderia cepacia]MBY4757354.1 PAAR domain-containing protein [Burkholderia cepacia]MBY4776258.1 PAAR domain-containing protein [Burkholderia cepacia]